LTRHFLNPEGATADSDLLERWIGQAKKGDLGAFQRLYDMFARRVFNFIYRMVASTEEAEDLTQDTFVTVYRKLGSLKDDARFEPWLFRIARNFVYQRYRRRPPPMISVDDQDQEGRAAVEFVDERKDPQQEYQSAELEQVVQRSILGLQEKYREVFVLSALQHRSYQEIADIVGRSLASVKTDIHRARLLVRKQVKEYIKV
jgi:RNA polymerase sigma-70 factor (ECF subfamily)